MVRNIITILTALPVLAGILAFVQGELAFDAGWQLGILVLLVVFLWLPAKMMYKVKPLQRLDKTMFQYAWFRKVHKALVGQKEYDEAERIFKEDK